MTVPLRDRIVTTIPVQVLWTESGELPAVRGRDLDRESIRELLRRGPVRFVVADVGHRIRWIPIADRFEFWKTDVAPRLAQGERFYLEDCPEETAYTASEWLTGENEPPVVLLEVHH